MQASTTKLRRHGSWFVTLAVILATGCGSGVPPDAVAVYDGGSITAPEARGYLRSLDRKRLRTGAAIDAEKGVAPLLGELAALKILAGEANEPTPPKNAFLQDPRASLLVSYYIERMGKRSHEVTDEQAQAFYTEHLADRFTAPEAVKFRHIFLRSDRHSAAELDRVVGTILDRLAAGTKFSELVTAYSESGSAQRGGEVGPVFRGRMDPTFEDGVWRLEAGKVGVVRTPQGVHVVEVLEKRPPEVTSYEAAKQQIVHAIMDRRNEAEREQLLATLRTRYVEVDRSADTSLPPDDVALRIKSREITRRQLDAYLAMQTMRRGPQVGAEQDLHRQLVDQLVTSYLLYLDAVDRGLDQEQAFTDQWTLADLKRRAGVAEQRRLESLVGTVNDEEVLRYYQDNKTRFAVPQRFQASYLQMPLGGGAPFALQQRLEELAKLAAAPGSDPAEVQRQCAEAGAVHVDMGWTTPVVAARVGPEFQRRLLAMTAPGSTPVFKDEGWLFVIQVRAVEARRPMTLPADRDLVRARYVELRRNEILGEIKARLLEERHFRVLSTSLLETLDGQEPAPTAHDVS